MKRDVLLLLAGMGMMVGIMVFSVSRLRSRWSGSTLDLQLKHSLLQSLSEDRLDGRVLALHTLDLSEVPSSYDEYSTGDPVFVLVTKSRPVKPVQLFPGRPHSHPYLKGRVVKRNEEVLTVSYNLFPVKMSEETVRKLRENTGKQTSAFLRVSVEPSGNAAAEAFVVDGSVISISSGKPEKREKRGEEEN